MKMKVWWTNWLNECEIIKVFRWLLLQILVLYSRPAEHGLSGNTFHFEGDSNVEIWPKLIWNTWSSYVIILTFRHGLTLPKGHFIVYILWCENESTSMIIMLMVMLLLLLMIRHKLKLSLQMPWSIKWGVEVNLHSILTRWRWVVTLTLRSFYLWERTAALIV
jgi:hypothetical protein